MRLSKDFAASMKPNRRSAVAVQMVAGYVNKGIVIVQGLVLIPLYLHFIGERMYGLWLASGGVLAWLSFMDMGIGGLLIQRVSSSYGRLDYKKTVNYFVNGLLVYGILDLILVLLVFCSALFLPTWFKVSTEEASVLIPCFLLAGVAFGAEFLNNCLRGFAQALLKPLLPMVFIVVFRILGLVAVVLFLYSDFGLWAISISLIINAIPVLFLNLWHCRHLAVRLEAPWCLEKDIILEFFRFSPALVAGRVGNSMVKNIEPTLIAIILKPEMATLFVITRRAADMIEQLLQVINASTFPSFAHLYAEGSWERARHAVSKIMILVFAAGITAFGTYVAGNHAFVDLWVGPGNFQGQSLSLFIALGLFALFVSQLFSRFLIGTGDILYPSWITLAEALFRIGLMTGLLYFLGLNGLPLGMMMSCTIFGLVYYKRLDKELHLEFFQNWKWLRPSLLLILLSLSAFAIGNQNVIISTWAKLGLYLFGIFVFLAIFTLALYPTLRELSAGLLYPYFKRRTCKT